MEMRCLQDFAEKILELNNDIRFVGIVDNEEKTLFSRMNKAKMGLLTKEEEIKFATDLRPILDLQNEFSQKVGKVTLSLIERDKVYQAILYKDNLTISVTFERSLSWHKIINLVNDIREKTKCHKF